MKELFDLLVAAISILSFGMVAICLVFACVMANTDFFEAVYEVASSLTLPVKVTFCLLAIFWAYVLNVMAFTVSYIVTLILIVATLLILRYAKYHHDHPEV